MVGLARMRSSNATISMTSTSTASAEHEHDEEQALSLRGEHWDVCRASQYGSEFSRYALKGATKLWRVARLTSLHECKRQIEPLRYGAAEKHS